MKAREVTEVYLDVLMAVPGVDPPDGGSRCTSGDASFAAHDMPYACEWVYKTISPGSLVHQACRGCFRVACTNDVVLARGTGLELLTVDDAGQITSLFWQPVFGAIQDLASYPAIPHDEVSAHVPGNQPCQKLAQRGVGIGQCCMG